MTSCNWHMPHDIQHERDSSDSIRTTEPPRCQIRLESNRYGWRRYQDGSLIVHAKGHAATRKSTYQEEGLAAYLGGALKRECTPDAFGKLVLSLNGCFAVVVQNGPSVYAAVDRVRSIPLFYSEQGTPSYVTDDANWLLSRLDHQGLDELSSLEFMLCGFVTGPQTLVRPIRQLQAGELLYCHPQHGGGAIQTVRYYRYLHHDRMGAAEAELNTQLEEVLHGVFQRLLETTQGKYLIVPLSGGYDSRLVVAMLKHLGRDNVICFSYDVLNQREARFSQQIAKKLGYPWHFVPYSRWENYRWYHSDERKEFSRYADGLCSISHIQDWPAVKELKEAGKVPDNAVFVPGHSGDFLAGSHLPEKMADSQVTGEENLVRLIWAKHYHLWPWLQSDMALAERLRQLVMENLPEVPLDSNDGVADAFECWDWQERQGKFIVNSVRVYEFWGYEWRIPLWDNQLMDFFARVPLHLRLRKKLYDAYLENNVFAGMGIADSQLEGLQAASHSTSSYSSGASRSIWSRAIGKILFQRRRFSKLLATGHGRHGKRELFSYLRQYGATFGWQRNWVHRININALRAVSSLREIQERLP